MKIKLANNSKYSFEEVMLAKSNGGAFVTYQWIIPTPIIKPVRRLSKVYFIPKEMKKSTYASQFNLISLIIGWWGLPYGPLEVYNSIVLNNKGGIDVTDDVYLNIDESGYKNGYFNLLKRSSKFVHPGKDETKELLKVFKPLVHSGLLKSLPIVGIYIDCGENEMPHTILGFNEDIKNKKGEIEKAIRKRFRSHYAYELRQLNDDSMLMDFLAKQGKEL